MNESHNKNVLMLDKLEAQSDISGSLSQYERADTSRSGKSRKSARSTSRRSKGQGPPPWPDPNKYDRRSLCFLTLQNPIRKGLIFAIENRWWDRIVLVVILINTVTLIARDPYDIPEFKPISIVRNVWDTMSMIFNIFFLAECICKVLALGFFFGTKSYLSTAWNWLDFIVVIIGTLELLPTGSSAGNLSALRSFRVLRPLRVVTKVPELRFLVVVILQSVPELGNVFGLSGFVWFVFGIIGVQLFQGATRGACYDIDAGTNSGTSLCSVLRRASDDPIQDQVLCPSSQECLKLAMPPNGGVTHFDNILSAFINIFQVMTQQGWTDILYALQASLSFHTWIYFVTLNFIGPYFVIQLFLVVISKKYAELKEEAAETLKILQKSSTATQPVNSLPNNQVFPEPYTEAEVELSAEAESRSGEAGRLNNAMDSGLDSAANGAAGPEGADGAPPPDGAPPQDDDVPPSDKHLAQNGHGTSRTVSGGSRREVGSRSRMSRLYHAVHDGWLGRMVRRVRGRLAVLAASTTLEYIVMAAISVNTLLMAIDADCEFCDSPTCARQKGVLELSNLAFTSIFTMESVLKLAGFGPMRYLWLMAPMSWLDVGIVASSLAEIPSVMTTSACYLNTQPCSGYDECEAKGGTSVLRIVRLARIVKLLSRFTSLQKQIKAIAKTASSVSYLVLLIVIFITIFVILGMNTMPGMVLQPWDAQNLMRGMQVFIVVPGDDMGTTTFPVPGRPATLLGQDSSNHSNRPWNFCFNYATPKILLSQGTGSCLWADVVDSAGMNTPAVVGAIERDNFDSPGIAYLTTMGILTTSNWNSQYYNAAMDFGQGIVFYYIAWIFIGNWVLFNMFVAILIQGISEEKKSKFRRQEELVAEKIKDMFFGLSEEELVSKIKVLFTEVDQDNSGVIDMNELEVVLVKHCKVDIGPRELIRLFRKYDDDDSGQINEEEFEKMIKELLDISKETLRKLLLNTVKDIFGGLSEDKFKAKTIEMFKEADKDHSGQIDEQELRELLGRHDIELMPKDLSRLLYKFGDEKSGETISKTGFTQMIAQLLEDAKLDSQPPASNIETQQTGSLISGLASAVIRRTSAVNISQQKMQEATDSPNNILTEFDVKERDQQLQGENAAPISVAARGPDQQMSLMRERTASNADSAETETATSVKASSLIPVQVSNTSSDNHDGDEAANLHSGDDQRAERSLFILSKNSKFRRFCIGFLEYPPSAPDSGKYFDNFILVCIIMSSCALAFENPRIGSYSQERVSLDRLNIFLNLAFLCECFLKIVADSFTSYLRSGWSRLDFFIVVTSTVDMTMTYLFTGQNVSLLKTFRILRILRALRPLRLIARAKSLRLLISALWGSIIPILGTCSIALLAYSMCSLLGMQLLKGKMKICSDPNFIEKKDCLANFDANGAHLQWTSYPVNWDNLYNGIVAMFILSSQDNWQNYMWAGTDAVSRTEGPMANANLFVAMFYVFCLLVSSFLVINLVISVFVDAYYTASATMEMSEGKKIEPRAKFQPIPEDVTGEIRLVVFNVVTQNAFDMFIAVFIVTNIVTMAFESYKQATWQTKFGEVTNIFYSLVFGWECMFKIFAYCPKRYYQAGWNRFDFFIVSISFGGILIDGLGSSVPMDPRTLRVLRLFRVFRILRAFRILKSARGLAKILGTLVKSLPALRNLMMLLALVFFIFAVLGVSMFGNLCVAGENLAPGLEGVRCFFSEQNPPLDPKVNFRDVGHALIALFRVATTDGWSALMFTALITPVRKQISPTTWALFQKLNGSETSFDALTSPQNVDYMVIVKQSLNGWKNSVSENGTFLSDSTGWPYPNTNATEWASIAKSILLNCITDDEASSLEAAGLMDCTTLGQKRPCSSTCTDYVTGTLFFAIFTLFSAFVLMQLVIAVLLQQLLSTSDKAESNVRTPGCEKLKLKVFDRMQRRWRYSALEKLKLESALRRRRQAMETPPFANDAE